MWFAAREAVERRATQRGRREGLREGRQEERDRITKALAEHGVELPPEIASMLSNGHDPDQSPR